MQSHKPNRPDELARIIAANGWITEEKLVTSYTLIDILYDDDVKCIQYDGQRALFSKTSHDGYE